MLHTWAQPAHTLLSNNVLTYSSINSVNANPIATQVEETRPKNNTQFNLLEYTVPHM